MGMRSSDTAQLFFEDVRVPAKNIIGDEGLGFTYQMIQFQEERLWGAAASMYSLKHSSFFLFPGLRNFWQNLPKFGKFRLTEG